MIFIKYLFVILHIVTAAAWFGIGLRVAGQARAAAAAADSAAGHALAEDVGRSVRLMGMFIVLTALFALGAFFAGGGFSAYGPVYHTSLLLIVILLGVQFGVIRTGWTGLRAALSEGAEADRHRRRIAIGTGVGHLLWLVLLVLMFWNQMQAAFQAA